MRPVSSSDLREDTLIPIRVSCSHILCGSHFNYIYLFVVPFYLTFYAIFLIMFSPLIITPRSPHLHIHIPSHPLYLFLCVYRSTRVHMCVHACLSRKQVNKNTKTKNNNKKLIRQKNANVKPKAHGKPWNWFCVGLL